MKQSIIATVLIIEGKLCFCISKNMEITHTGLALRTILKDLVGQIITGKKISNIIFT